ncbi:MAG: phytanoyl-CoA dioxygenase family protein [Rhodocyclaceae bacterium]|nr:phytanoyl-CoA dioxygenase family protein [Rhodocyclaceae bacterium]
MRNQYGAPLISPEPSSWIEEAAEEICVQGYTVVHDMFTADTLEEARMRLDALYEKQALAFGEKRLKEIGDELTVRAPLLEDDFFLRFAAHERLLTLVEHVLAAPPVLYLQNGILNNVPDHPQTRWHRDLPYQRWMPNRPATLNALYALDDFRADNGATLILPHSHRLDPLPSWRYCEKHAFAALVPAGSVLVFDSWLWHRAGDNASGAPRRALNHIYATPVFQPFYDFRPLLERLPHADARLHTLLGKTYQTHADGTAWREARYHRLQTQ